MVTQILAKLLSLKNKKKPKIWYLILLKSQSILVQFQALLENPLRISGSKSICLYPAYCGYTWNRCLCNSEQSSQFPSYRKRLRFLWATGWGKCRTFKNNSQRKVFYLCMQYAAKVRKYKVLEFLVNGNQIQYTAVGKIVKNVLLGAGLKKIQNMA